jgi:iron complex transport system substrate-binding protein
MRFNDYVIRIYGEMGAASGGKLNPVPKVAVLMPGNSGDAYIVGTDGFLGDVIKISGGISVGPKGTSFVPLNAESLVSFNPDVILVPGTKFDVSGADKVLKDPRFATVSAVKQKRVIVLDADILLREGQRVDQLIKAVHRAIAPPTE